MNDIRIIDTHCHLDFKELKTRLDEVIKDAKISGTAISFNKLIKIVPKGLI